MSAKQKLALYLNNVQRFTAELLNNLERAFDDKKAKRSY
jgi:hypothetical protein